MSDLLARFLGWLGDLFFHLLATILGWIVDLVKLIPVPEFLNNLSPIQFPEAIGYFVAPYELEHGVIIITSAYAARFIIRRLPFVG